MKFGIIKTKDNAYKSIILVMLFRSIAPQSLRNDQVSYIILLNDESTHLPLQLVQKSEDLLL